MEQRSLGRRVHDGPGMTFEDEEPRTACDAISSTACCWMRSCGKRPTPWCSPFVPEVPDSDEANSPRRYRRTTRQQEPGETTLDTCWMLWMIRQGCVAQTLHTSELPRPTSGDFLTVHTHKAAICSLPKECKREAQLTPNGFVLHRNILCGG